MTKATGIPQNALQELKRNLRNLDAFVNQSEMIAAKAFKLALRDNNDYDYLDDYLDENDFDSWIAIQSNRGKFTASVVSLFVTHANEIAKFTSNGMIRLHRVMELAFDPIEAILAGKRDLGRFWTYEPFNDSFLGSLPRGNVNSTRSRANNPTGLSRQPPTEYIFVCDASAKSIEWYSTLWKDIEFSSVMKEIELRYDQPLKLVAITKGITDALDISKIQKLPFIS
jgi:hypothetical protein